MMDDFIYAVASPAGISRPPERRASDGIVEFVGGMVVERIVCLRSEEHQPKSDIRIRDEGRRTTFRAADDAIAIVLAKITAGWIGEIALAARNMDGGKEGGQRRSERRLRAIRRKLGLAGRLYWHTAPRHVPDGWQASCQITQPGGMGARYGARVAVECIGETAQKDRQGRSRHAIILFHGVATPWMPLSWEREALLAAGQFRIVDTVLCHGSRPLADSSTPEVQGIFTGDRRES